MLGGSFTEGSLKIVHLHDVEYSTFLLILEFLTTDSCQMDESNVMDLFHASCFYGLSLLQQSCENYLEICMDVDNCVDILIVAHSLNAFHLKSSCINFILR